MNKIFTFISGALLLFAFSFRVSAQSSFNIQHDTVTYTWTGSSLSPYSIEDGITNLDTGGLVISWKVIASDFPADWIAASGICDDSLCYTVTSLWPSSHLRNSSKYPHGPGDFHLQTVLTTASSGTHYITVRLQNQTVGTDTAIETYILTNPSNAGVGTITKSNDDVLLYPNPAHDELNIVYDASADVKNIAVYNIIGKVLAVYKVTDNSSANLNLENIPSGIYFVRLMNSRGAVVVTRKFTKQ